MFWSLEEIVGLIFMVDSTYPARLILLFWVFNTNEASHHLGSDDLWRWHPPYSVCVFDSTRRGEFHRAVAFISLGRCVLPASACLPVIAFGLACWGVWEHYSRDVIGSDCPKSFFGGRCLVWHSGSYGSWPKIYSATTTILNNLHRSQSDFKPKPTTKFLGLLTTPA